MIWDSESDLSWEVNQLNFLIRNSKGDSEDSLEILLRFSRFRVIPKIPIRFQRFRRVYDFNEIPKIMMRLWRFWWDYGDSDGILLRFLRFCWYSNGHEIQKVICSIFLFFVISPLLHFSFSLWSFWFFGFSVIFPDVMIFPVIYHSFEPPGLLKKSLIICNKMTPLSS